MKNMRMIILSVMMVSAIGYALEEPQGFIDIYTIPTQNYKHRCALDGHHEALRKDLQDIATISMARRALSASICSDYHDWVEQMKQIEIEERESCSRSKEHYRGQAQEHLRWYGGYIV